MIACTVHEPPDAGADRIDRAENLEFIKDGFSFFAFLLPPIWMVANRLWRVLVIYVLALVALGTALAAFAVPDSWSMLVSVAVNAWVGFEADSLKRWSLQQSGWTDLGTVSGRNQTECERAFFEHWLPSQPIFAGADARRSPDLVTGGPAFASPDAPPADTLRNDPSLASSRAAQAPRASTLAGVIGRAFGRRSS